LVRRWRFRFYVLISHVAEHGVNVSIDTDPGWDRFVENGKILVTELAELYKITETAPEAPR
jgi:hypothetical protein